MRTLRPPRKSRNVVGDVVAVRERRRDAEAVVEAAEQADVRGEALAPERGRIELEPQRRSPARATASTAPGPRRARRDVQESWRNSALAPTPNSSADGGDRVARSPRRPSTPRSRPTSRLALGVVAAATAARRIVVVRCAPAPGPSSSSAGPESSSSFARRRSRRCSRPRPCRGVVAARPRHRRVGLAARAGAAAALALLRLRQRHRREDAVPPSPTRRAARLIREAGRRVAPQRRQRHRDRPGRRTVPSSSITVTTRRPCSCVIAISAKFRGATPTAQK